MMKLVSLVVFGISLLRMCDSYGTGAPPGACVDMTPGHLYNQTASRPISPQSGESPFSVTRDKDEYEKGEQLSVTVTGTTSFVGFLLQARAADEEVPVGEFSDLGEKMKYIAECSTNYPKGALTHADQHLNATLWDSFTVIWTAPDEDLGDISFYATVAQNHDIFWVQVPSDTISYSGFAVLSPTVLMSLVPVVTVAFSTLM